MYALRMYFFVLYSLSAMQKGIQAGHAALEYAKKYGDDKLYKEFVSNHKTWIVLDGGTTNDSLDHSGTLNDIQVTLTKTFIKHAYFREPDLNNSLTAICLLADERVWNRDLVPDLVSEIEGRPALTLDWYNRIGGVKNATIRELISGRRLAS